MFYLIMLRLRKNLSKEYLTKIRR